MNKRISCYSVFFIVTGLVFTVILNYPSILFESSDKMYWNIARCLAIAIMLGVFVVGILIGIINRRLLIPYFTKFKKFYPLLFLMVRRDFLAKYKRSVLGVLWSVLNPLLTMLVLTLVFSYLFRFDIENYPVYLLSGQIVFTLFSEITNLCMSSILGGASMIKKISLPKYIFPVSRAISCLVNFLFSFIALICVMLFTGSPFYWHMLYIPIATLYVFVFSTGIGFILSTLVVFFRDINYLYGILLTAVTYFTPLFYPIGIIPDRFRWVISINPMYHFVEYFRTVAIYGNTPTMWQNVICCLFALLSIGMGLFVFYKKQDEFILYI